MIDKKIIVVIVLFIVGGLFIYSFANPLSEGTEGTGSMNDDPAVEENQKDSIEEENDPEMNDKSEENNESSNETNDMDNEVSNPSNGINTNNPSGNNSVNPIPPIEKPVDKEENQNQTNPNEGKEEQNPTNPDEGKEDSKDPSEENPRPLVSSFGLSKEESANVQIITNGNHITYKGEMDEKTPLINGNKTYPDYINIMVMSPDALSQTEFDQIKLIYKGKTYGKEEFLIDNATQKAYFYLLQPFNRANEGIEENLTTVSFQIYWGYGETKTYTITFDIKVNEKATN